MSFVLGQRWVSDTEIEQGLGTVITIEARMVTLLFPVTGKLRTYSINNAPLVRVQFSPGDKAESREGWVITVTKVTEKAGIITYTGLLEDDQERKLVETDIGDFISFNKPQDRMLAGLIDTDNNYSLRYKTLLHNHRILSSPVRGLIGPRVSLIPHQLHIAREVSNRYAPRVMLADEVGMGKTIEAGLILHQQLISGRAERVLIIVPENLLHQWLVEMLRRFNLYFSLFDEDRLENSNDDNPFASEQLILCSLDFFCSNECRLEQAMEVDWDLMIVDEAHHLAWSSGKPSLEYQCIEKLAARIPGLLLLTATPEQMGLESHFARLRLLDSDRFHDFVIFQEEARSYESVASAVQELLEKEQLSDQARKDFKGFLGDSSLDLIRLLEQGTPKDKADAQSQLLHQLLDRHGTGRILFRNARAAVAGFPGRIIHGCPLVMPKPYQLALDKEQEGAHSLRHYLFPEIAYQAHFKVEDVAPWWKVDPRVEWLISQIKLLRKKKVLVICAELTTALDLGDAMRILSGIPTTVFHEGMSIIDRDRSAAWFADEEYGAQVMVCSEIGSEGRNFQFASHLVLFDLPEHPDLLEQRIGRLDRIGQTEAINIYAPYIKSSGQEVLFHWYHEGLDAFVNTCPAGNTVFQELKLDLQQLLKPCGVVNSFDIQPLLNKTKSLNKELKDNLHNGRDRLLELNSRGLSSNEDLINDIEAREEPRQLMQYAEKLFESFGVDVEDHSRHCLIIRPGSHMVTSLPRLPDDGVTVTFDREMALSREDMQFLSWEHPMISESMENILMGETGTVSVVLLKNKALKSGTMLLEVIYVVEAYGDKILQLDRYLPITPIRTLIDLAMNNLAEKCTFDTLTAQLRPIKKGFGKKLVRAQKETILTMLARAEECAKVCVESIVDDACKKLFKDVTEEIERLSALKAVNPNVREEEIEHLKGWIGLGHQCLQKAVLRSDAIRLMVAG
ncbi:MAG: RNA polymerase-associated protein RapA [Candidatus Endonucleobacter bathymodioli]|uniref:RNA polymerase-associated protein RapA n=1 Tax=Candidatus Endonucleibacter bathymodioli TaxID=539814 RepID=A0AA90NSN9_9GAMM|nr:RNA polymerase-associated protein RapA [Candidatus Endonucleobacter bathymodioli]